MPPCTFLLSKGLEHFFQCFTLLLNHDYDIWGKIKLQNARLVLDSRNV